LLNIWQFKINPIIFGRWRKQLDSQLQATRIISKGIFYKDIGNIFCAFCNQVINQLRYFAFSVIGNSGNNGLTGGIGADILTGGSGNDSFNYSFLSDSNQAAHDTITDFAQGLDHINLHDLAFAGIISFDDLVVTNDNAHNETIITANDNHINAHTGAAASTHTDFELHLKGLVNLHQEDFTWG